MRLCDANGNVTFEAIPSAAVAERQRAAQDSYLRAARELKAAGREAEAAHLPRPEVRVWRTVMGGVDVVQRAQAVVQDCRRQEAEAKLKREAEPKR